MDWKNQLTRTPYLVLFIVLITVGVGTASALITITLAGDVIIEGNLQLDGDLECTDCIDSSNIESQTVLIDKLVTIESIGGTNGIYTSIALTSQDIPVISYTDGSTKTLRVAFCGDAKCGSGIKIRSLDLSSTGFTFTSLAMDSGDKPVVSYYDVDVGDLLVLTCGNKICTTGINTETVDSTNDVGKYNSLALASGDIPVISYYDEDLDHLKFVKCGNTTCSSGNIFQTLDSTGSVGRYTSIALASGDIPVISYYDFTDRDLNLIRCGDATCSTGNTITTVDSSSNNQGQYTSLFLTAGDIPVISYYDLFTQDLRFVRCDDTTCSSGNTYQTLDSNGIVGFYTSIALTSNNIPVISYYDVTNLDLKIITCGDKTCSSGNSIRSVDVAHEVGQFISMALTFDDIPVVSYFDNDNAAPKFFTQEKIVFP